MQLRGTSSTDVIADLRRAIGTGDDRLWDGVLVTPRVANIIRRADDATIAPRDIEPGDLFDAICAEGGIAAELLTRSLETSERVRE